MALAERTDLDEVVRDFGTIDLMRRLPTAVAYAALVSRVPGVFRLDLNEALKRWEGEQSAV